MQNTCLFTHSLRVGLLSVNRTGKEMRLNGDFFGVCFSSSTTLHMNAFVLFFSSVYFSSLMKIKSQNL